MTPTRDFSQTQAQTSVAPASSRSRTTLVPSVGPPHSRAPTSSLAPLSARLALRNVVDACAFVDRLAEADVGELVVVRGAIVCGSVFVEHGRVCWAAARGLAPRLTKLLIESAKTEGDPTNVTAASMEEHYRVCKAEGVPLGELLVSRGIVSAERLRAALIQHTAESLDLLCHPDASATWHARQGGYSARFTFQTAELLARCCSHKHRHALREDATDVLSLFSEAEPGEWGGVFLRDPSYASPVPIALRGSLPDKSTSLVRVGKWAASALDLAATFQEAAHRSAGEAGDAGEGVFVTSMRPDGSALVAWRDAEKMVAGCMQAAGPARILNHRATLRRARTRTQ